MLYIKNAKHVTERVDFHPSQSLYFSIFKCYL